MEVLRSWDEGFFIRFLGTQSGDFGDKRYNKDSYWDMG